MTNDELDAHAKAWHHAAEAMRSSGIYDAVQLLKVLPQLVADGYTAQKTPTAG